MEEVADLPDEVFGFGNWLLWLVATRATAVVDRVYQAGPARPSRTYGQVAGHPVPTPSLVAWLLAARELGVPLADLDPDDPVLSSRQKSLRTVVSRAVKGEPRLFKDVWLHELADVCGFEEQELRFLLRNRDDEGHAIDPAGLRKAIAATFEQRDVVAGSTGRAATAAVAGPAAMRTLPADVPSFTGRRAELSALTQALPDDGGDQDVIRIAIIDGMAGVGKTAFAVHAAHQLSRHFPDGQIFVSLHGHNPSQRPADPSDVLCALLLEVGVAPDQIPADLDARAALWRNRMAGRSIVLLLDDATDSEQVRPLLPGSGRTLVLVTSRRKLTALPHAQALSIDVLNATDAGALFVRLADRPGLEPDGAEVADIARSCGFLPLGISLVAGQLKHHAAWTAGDLACDLASSAGRLRLMAAEGLSVTAAFELSYRSLRPDLQRLFRRLSLLPGADFDAYAGAAVDDADLVGTGERLDELFRCHLIAEPVRGRYRFHDLISEHARTLAAADPEAERSDARTRLLGYYLHTARAASRYLSRVTHTGDFDVAVPPAHSPAMLTWHDAIAWMDAEHLNLHAAVEFAAAQYAAACQQPGFATAIPCAVNGYLLNRGRWSEGIALHGIALKVAREAGDRAAEACALSDLGQLQYLTGKTRAATAILSRAAELQRRLGSPLGEANATLRLGCLCLATGDNQAALEKIISAQALYREVGDRLGAVGAVYYLGIERYLTGQYRASAHALATALEMYRALGILSGQADVLSYLGAVQHATGRSEAAAANLARALRLYRDIGDRREEAGALYFLGAVQREADDPRSAMTTLKQALRLYHDFGDQFGEAGVLNQIGLIKTSAGDYESARRNLNLALAIYRRYDSRAGEAEVSNGLGELALATGDLSEALACHRAALAITTQTTDQLEEARAREGLGLCGIRAGRTDQGIASLREAMTIYRRIGSPRLRRVEHLIEQAPTTATAR